VKKVFAIALLALAVAGGVSAAASAAHHPLPPPPSHHRSCNTHASCVLVFTATLTGPGESPPNHSHGTGTATVTWNTSTNQMTVNVTFSGLSSPTTASHIHCCVTPPGAAGVATTTPTFPGFPLGVTAGTYSHTFDMTDPASYNPAFITANGGTATSAEAVLLTGLQAGQAYLNIHTMNFPGGEIRGFLQQL
jgi:hypothetical protein